MNSIVEVLSWIFILFGLFSMIVAVIGVYKLPDVYTRQHALSLIDTGGTFAVCVGLALRSGFSLVSIKVILLAILIALISAPITYVYMQIVIKKKVDVKK